jgi:hypothetical protein
MIAAIILEEQAVRHKVQSMKFVPRRVSTRGIYNLTLVMLSFLLEGLVGAYRCGLGRCADVARSISRYHE